MDSEINVIDLPVFVNASIFPMLPPSELAELAEDIKENGLNEPLVVAKVDDQLMLIDGRNRLAACKLVGVTPTYRIIEADAEKLKSLVWSWNGPRRHLSSSQKAMSYAMLYPDGEKGGRGKKLLQNCNSLELSPTEKGNISRARFILKNDLEKAELVRDGHPEYPLSRTYDEVKLAVEEKNKKSNADKQQLDRLDGLRSKHDDLANRVSEETLSLETAFCVAELRSLFANDNLFDYEVIEKYLIDGKMSSESAHSQCLTRKQWKKDSIEVGVFEQDDITQMVYEGKMSRESAIEECNQRDLYAKQLTLLENDAPDLALLVNEGRMKLKEAEGALTKRIEQERVDRDAAFRCLRDFASGEALLHRPEDIKKLHGHWTEYSNKYYKDRKSVLKSLGLIEERITGFIGFIEEVVNDE